MEPAPPRFQYSLWSLVVLTTVVAVLCSIGATTHWSVAIVIIVGIAVCSIGFRPAFVPGNIPKQVVSPSSWGLWSGFSDW